MVTPWFSTMFSPRTSEIHRCGEDCQVGKTSNMARMEAIKHEISVMGFACSNSEELNGINGTQDQSVSIRYIAKQFLCTAHTFWMVLDGG